MSDLIERQKALDGLKYEMKYGAEIDRCGLDTAYDIIENIPLAEPERKTVKVEKSQIKCFDGVLVVNSGHCDCGTLVFNDQRYKYCPHCGARLEWNE